MTDTSPRIVRTDLDGYEDALRPHLVTYFEWSDDLATSHFDALDGLDAADAAEGDLDRLRSPEIDRPLVLALDDGEGADGSEIVATGQLKRLSDTDAELKRLYVVPERRGEGLGRAVAERLIDAARADGFETLRLGVGPYLDAARSLYESLGFTYTEPYEWTQCPEVMHDEWCFMRLSLTE